jgi:hypothetical protein
MKRNVFFAAVLCFGCEHVDLAPVPLNGQWVDVQTKTDTLIFNSEIGEDFFILRRGKEPRNGFLLPKRGTGIYKFVLKPQAISVYNLISSCYCFNDYFFKRNGKAIFVENFYDPLPGDLRTFEKLP